MELIALHGEHCRLLYRLNTRTKKTPNDRVPSAFLFCFQFITPCKVVLTLASVNELVQIKSTEKLDYLSSFSVFTLTVRPADAATARVPE